MSVLGTLAGRVARRSATFVPGAQRRRRTLVSDPELAAQEAG
jgi:hypothetical protein